MPLGACGSKTACRFLPTPVPPRKQSLLSLAFTRRLRRLATARAALAGALVALALTAPVSAQVPTGSPERAGQAGARAHFDRALELYRAGQYAPARDELKAAAALDPGGKDLFFNLALVQEKLGELEQAILALQRFRELESDATERE